MDDELMKILRDSLPSEEEQKALAKRAANFMADLLRQEYRLHEGAWWLFSLGKPARPLREDEIVEARERGQIP